MHWSNRRLHISWLIALGCSGILIGTALAVLETNLHFANIAWLISALAMLAATVLKRTVAMVALAVAGGVLLGLWRGAIEQNALKDYMPYYSQTVQLTGTVAQDIEFGPKGEQRLRLKNIHINSKQLSGQVWVSIASRADIKRSDIIALEGKLSQGFGNLPATMQWATLFSAQRPQPGDVARVARDWFAEGVRQAIPEPQASLGVGYLTGQHSTLPETLDNQLQILGLTHIVVASGYNLTILVRIARRVFARISKYLATLSAAGMIGGFVLVTGLSPSMSRAGLVAGLSLAAWYYGRKIHPFVLLPFAAAITVMFNPSYIWGDVGWYLSFASFAGVLMLAPLLQQYFWGNKKPGMFRQILFETMSAQLVTLPVVALVFGQYSPLALPANLLILPLVPLAMLLTFIGGVAALVIPGVAAWFGIPANLVLHYMTSVIEWLGNLPWAQGDIEFGVVAMVVSYILLFLVGVYLWYRTRHDFSQDNIVE